MKVVLLGDVKKLGGQGDIVDVAEGYARNFLFPQHLAVEATDAEVKRIKDKEKSVARRSKKEEREEKKLVKFIDGEEIVISAKADGGSLYAAITEKEIRIALKEKGFIVKKDWIKFDPVKELGSHEALVVTPSGFEASVTVSITSK